MTSPAYWRAPKRPTLPVEIGSVHGPFTVVATAPSLGTGARYRVRCEAGHQFVRRGVEIRAGKVECPECREAAR